LSKAEERGEEEWLVSAKSYPMHTLLLTLYEKYLRFGHEVPIAVRVASER